MKKTELQKLYQKYRPAFHFAAKKGWINDPNGLIFYEGYYHLFYQFYPDGITHGTMHWGHARTKDFMEWEELPVALYPDELGVIFSGCMVYDENNTSGFGSLENPPLVAVFTHHLETEEKCVQYQSLAYSLDKGEHFIKYKNNPVLDFNLKDFRDPKVFWDETLKKWVLLVSTGKEILFYTSLDLKDWTFWNLFSGKDLMPDEIWECPDFVELEDGQGEKKWVLFVSQNSLDYIQTGIRYFVGDYGKNGFMPEESAGREQYLDFGRDNYAVATYARTGSRVIQQGWMNCWRYAEKIPAVDFRGSMTLPRELKIQRTPEGYRVLQKPVEEVGREMQKDLHIVPDHAALHGEVMPGIYRYTPEGKTGKIVFSNRNNRLEITVDFVYGKIIVDRSGCGELFYDPYFQETGWSYFSGEAEKEVYVILDVTSIEVFAAGGEAVGTFQYFIKEAFDKITTGSRTDEGK